MRWHIVRQYDPHGGVQQGTVVTPFNVVLYRYWSDGNVVYLSDIYDTSPTNDPTTKDLRLFAHHAHLEYESRSDGLVSFRSGWRMEHRMRIRRIDVSAKPFESSGAPRQLLRRYHFQYDLFSHASLLTSFQQEGRCATPVTENASGVLPETTCSRLPALTFGYQRVRSELPPATDSDGLRFEPLAAEVRGLPNSPPHSLGQMETGIMDINGDSLPDVLVAAAGLHGNAHGLYLNGTTGELGFGDLQRMTVTGGGTVDAGVLKLSNKHVSVLDLDADGQVNLVHMPNFQGYTVFSPLQTGADWSWSAKSVSSPPGQDIRIDWTKNAEHTAAMDVNSDGLVNVVYASPTELQTFFALGRYPGGEHQFGHASWTSANTASISTEPVRSCVPWSATPARLGDPDVRIAELNGDGLPDLVRIRSGQILYWPGRGNGTWGTGERDDCAPGGFGTDRSIKMGNAPVQAALDLSSVQVSDVNGDGLANLLKVRVNAVDVYLNQNGVGFTNRVVIPNTPVLPNGSRRFAMADMDGTGTLDLLWGEAGNYQYIDLTGGVQPNVLTRIDNGLGATTELDYSTSTRLMLAATAAGKRWTSTVPTVVPVVTRSTVRDNLERIGRPAGSMITEFEYRNPRFDGRARDFAGFREALIRTIGDANSPTSIKRTEFLVGHWSDDPSLTAEPTSREPWRVALKGMPIVEEQLDTAGVALSTKHESVNVQAIYQGLDGRSVYARSGSTATTFVYDTAAFDGAESEVSVQDYSVDDGATQYSSQRALTRRATRGTAQIRSSVAVDVFGNVTTSIRNGCVSGCPNGPDEAISTVSSFARPQHDLSGWLWRETESYVSGTSHSVPAHRHGASYNVFGDVTETFGWLSGTQALTRVPMGADTPSTASGGLAEEEKVSLGSVIYDAFGNPTFSTGPSGECRGIIVDSVYSEFVVEDQVYAGAREIDGCGENVYVTKASYDRGFALPVSVISPQGQPSSVQYDGFGRAGAVFGPSESSPGELDLRPRALYEYVTPSNASTQPYSMVRSQSINESHDGKVSYLEDVAYIDGLGRSIFALGEVDPDEGDGGRYIVSGGVRYNTKGMPYLSHEPFFSDGPAIGFALSTQPTTATKRQVYDAFGRVLQVILQDDQVKSEARYHALSGDTFDAGDLSEHERYRGTYTTQISDGHGRTAASISRYRADGTTLEEHRTNTTYLPSGEVVTITQQRAGSLPYTRRFEYDSWGRLVNNIEPNTTGVRTWRYAYDNSSRLVGTSDANGCGANYHYDSGGRLIGEDYSPCLANHAVYTPPNLDTGEGLETYYRYDAPDPTATNVVDGTGQRLQVEPDWLWGRVASVKSRGAFNVFAYDSLGRTRGVARRIVRPDATDSMSFDARYAPRWYVKQSSFDLNGRPTRISTGAPILSLLGEDGTSEIRLSYTKRGLVRAVGSTYGTLISRELRDARGLLDDVVLGDAAQTRRSYAYNELTQVVDVTTYRAPPSMWTTGAGVYSRPEATAPPTTQLTLEHYGFQYDVMGNLVRADDFRPSAEWTDHSRPVRRQWEYDSYSRLTKTTYEYVGANTWRAPFHAENADPTRPQPTPQVSFDTRISEETFSYDWLNNLVTNSDNSNGFYDRSIGTSTFADNTRPHRLSGASNRSTDSVRRGELAVAHDDVGQVTAMIVQRDGSCLPSGASCWTRFAYEWDEVGNLTRARRWDLSPSERPSFGTAASVDDGHPTRTPEVEMRYHYDGGDRVLKTVVRGDDAAISSGDDEPKHTVYVFSTLEIRSADWTGAGDIADYELNAETTDLRLPAGSVVGRLVWDGTMPRTGTSSLHLLLTFSDHLGSTTFTIDHATSELVEYVSYTAYGQTESDYRTERWSSFREPTRFTGKEEDIEVGLNYHGARYYSPALKRWMSADPVTIHSAGSDINPWAYGYGNPTSFVDPDGREPLTVIGLILLASAVSGATNATVQYAQTGRVNWGWRGVAGAAVAGTVGAGVGMGVSSLATGVLGSSAGGVAVGGAVGGASGGALGSAFAGSNGYGIATAALSGAVSGAVGGAVGVAAGSKSGGWTGFGGVMAGTGAGTATGIAFNAGILGQDASIGSIGTAFASAFGGAIASAALSAGWSEATEEKTGGQAAGEAAGKAALRANAMQEAVRNAAGFAQDPTGNNNIILELLTSGVPKPTIGQVIPGEPITDPYVQKALLRAWNDTRPWSEATREQGGWGHPIPDSVSEYWVERWPEGTRGYIDRGSDTVPDRNSFSFHSHGLNEWHDPTYTKQSASLGDWLMFRQFQMTDPAHIHYIISAHGIFRLSGNQQQWIAPIGYLSK
ncbi:MAG: toxin TcdB middle/N-terminal domain-containing protein [Polyangiaceae bacterium]